MQIILLEKITNVGNLGDVVKVKDGVRAQLTSSRRARRSAPTPENLKADRGARAELEKAANERLTGAQQIAEQLEGKGVQVTQKAGVDGRLFGSVDAMPTSSRR
jgi:large subunit ribosomal protein L9